MSFDPYYMGSWVYDIFVEPFMTPIRRLSIKILREKLMVASGARVLEVACGTGTQSSFLAREGFDVVALDKSYQMIKQAHRKKRAVSSLKLTTICGDASNMPFMSSVFDVVVLQLGLHEMKIKVRDRSAKELKRVASEKAIFMIVDFIPPKKFNFSNFILSMVELAAGIDHFRNGRNFLKAGGLLQFLDSTGLKALTTYSFFQGNICLIAACKKEYYGTTLTQFLHYKNEGCSL